MSKKFKIVKIHDISLVPSGVGTQAKILTEGLLKTGKYTFREIGGAIKHPSYNPIKVEPYGDDFIIFPKDGFGDKMFLRSILDTEKPDAVMLFTDPRFFVWVWEMADEILPRCPILYWHVWDNLPVPRFNDNFYRSTTYTCCISKLTHHIMKSLNHEKCSSYVPHAIDHNIFKQLDKEECEKQREQILKDKKDKFVIFWNNRNARRKNPSDVIFAVSELNKRINNDAVLLMHTNPFDQEGPNLIDNIEMMNAKDFVSFSSERVPPDRMNVLYNISDVTLNIAYAEGFGLSNLESMTAGTCVIANKTGGLQDQIDETVEEKDKWGWLIGPDNTTLVGSQQIAYIKEERVNIETIVDTLEHLYRTTNREERKRRGLLAREHSMKNFGVENMIKTWDETFTDVITNYKEKYHHFENWRVHVL
jgi:glycosyltransferase involved in cell wall biosynthesis